MNYKTNIEKYLQDFLLKVMIIITKLMVFSSIKKLELNFYIFYLKINLEVV